MKPRVLFVARTRYRLPLSPTLQRRFDALSAVLDWRQLGTSLDGPPVQTDRFTLVRRLPLGPLEGAAFYAALPARVVAGAAVVSAGRRDRPGSPGHGVGDARAQPRPRPRADRLRRPRRLAHRHAALRLAAAPSAQPARRQGRAASSSGTPTACAPSRASRSGLVREQGVEPTATFPAYMDLAPFTAEPARGAAGRRRRRCSSACSSATRAIDVLAEAWPQRASHASPARGSTSSAGDAWPTSSKRLVAERSLGVELDARAARPRASPARSTSRPCSCFPRAGKGWGAWSSRRSAVAARSSAPTPAASPTSSRTGSAALLVPADDPEALAAALVARARRTGARRAPRRGLRTPLPGAGWPRRRSSRRGSVSWSNGDRPQRLLDFPRARALHKAARQERGLPRCRGSRPPADAATPSGLRVLLYHKVNDVAGNPGSVPTALFAEHMALVRGRGLPARLARGRARQPLRRHAAAAPRHADHLRRRLPRQPRRTPPPSSQRHGFPAVLFVQRRPDRLRHPASLTTSARGGSATPPSTGTNSPSWRRWACGSSRTASQHRAARDARGRCGRARADGVEAASWRSASVGPIRAYAYVKGGLADFDARHRTMLQRAGYEAAFTTVTGSNRSGADSVRAEALQHRALPDAHARARPRAVPATRWRSRTRVARHRSRGAHSTPRSRTASR